MDIKICQTIKKLRLSNNISQETLANALGISTQAISKWENLRALPDITLLPDIAAFFNVTIDTLFVGSTKDEKVLPTTVNENLQINRAAWNNISQKGWEGSTLPSWGVYIPGEEQLRFLEDITGKNVLEIACGAGKSLLYCSRKKPRELWGLDISEVQLEKARRLLQENGVEANLYQSPMETNPGIPEHHFDCVYSVYGIGWTQDLDKTISLVSRYLKTNGTFVFSWDSPILPCLETINGQYVLNRSYVEEARIRRKQRGEPVVMTFWKMATFVNSLSKHGFKIERLVEDSCEISEDAVFTNEYYSEYKAQYINHTFVMQARKL